MTSAALTRFARWLLLATGVGDLGAGVTLAIAPLAGLSLAGLTMPEGDATAYLRWVGVFAAAVGAVYLRGGLQANAFRIRETLVVTLIFRMAVGTYATFAVLRGWLAPAWSAVAIANVGLVVLQAGLLAKGAGRDE
jgi:hypothetical protein